MTGAPKPFHGDPRKKRRLNAGRRRSPETDAQRTIREDDLHEIERTFARLRDLEPIHRKDAYAVVRLVAEVRRLRQLIKRVRPFTVGLYGAAKNPEDEKELLQLEEELKTEVARG
jgi:hypothetical protein